MNFPVHWFSSDMGGVPDITNSLPGGLNDVLKGCLIDGFNTLPVVGMTYDSGTGEVTVDVGENHGYIRAQVIEITGADQAEYNGQFRVTGTNKLGFTFKPDSVPGAATASGATIECYCPPADGWEIVYEDAPNFLLILGRTDAAATPYKWRILNDKDYSTNQSYGNWVANTETLGNYVDEATFDIVMTQYWAASYAYSDVGAEWFIAADSLFLYFNNRYAQNEGNSSTFVWGDIIPVNNADNGHCMTNGVWNSGSNIRWNHESYRAHNDFAEHGTTRYRNLATDFSNAPGQVNWSSTGIGQYFADHLAYPNPATNGFHVWQGPIICEEAGGHIRGFIPGLMQPLHDTSNLHKHVVETLPGLEGVPVLLWETSKYEYNDRGANSKLIAINLGDWRSLGGV